MLKEILLESEVEMDGRRKRAHYMVLELGVWKSSFDKASKRREETSREGNAFERSGQHDFNK